MCIGRAHAASRFLLFHAFSPFPFPSSSRVKLTNIDAINGRDRIHRDLGLDSGRATGVFFIIQILLASRRSFFYFCFILGRLVARFLGPLFRARFGLADRLPWAECSAGCRFGHVASSCWRWLQYQKTNAISTGHNRTRARARGLPILLPIFFWCPSRPDRRAARY